MIRFNPFTGNFDFLGDTASTNIPYGETEPENPSDGDPFFNTSKQWFEIFYDDDWYVIGIGTIPPSAPTIYSVDGDTSGEYEGTTATPEVVINDVLEGDLVTVYNGDTNVGSDTANSTSITITTDELEEGEHTLTATILRNGIGSERSDSFIYTYIPQTGEVVITPSGTNTLQQLDSMFIPTSGTLTSSGSVFVRSGSNVRYYVNKSSQAILDYKIHCNVSDGFRIYFIDTIVVDTATKISSLEGNSSYIGMYKKGMGDSEGWNFLESSPSYSDVDFELKYDGTSFTVLIDGVLKSTYTPTSPPAISDLYIELWFESGTYDSISYMLSE